MRSCIGIPKSVQNANKRLRCTIRPNDLPDQIQPQLFLSIIREVNPSNLFLQQQIDVIDLQRSKLLVSTLKVKQQTTERNENSPINHISNAHKPIDPIRKANRITRKNLHGILGRSLLKSVDLAVTDIVVVVSKSLLLAHADLSPAGTHILLAVKSQSRG